METSVAGQISATPKSSLLQGAEEEPSREGIDGRWIPFTGVTTGAQELRHKDTHWSFTTRRLVYHQWNSLPPLDRSTTSRLVYHQLERHSLYVCCFQTHCWCKCPLELLTDHRYAWSLDVNKCVCGCLESQHATTPTRGSARLRPTMKTKSISYSNSASFECEKGLCSCPPAHLPPPLAPPASFAIPPAHPPPAVSM